jgi:hypothetical protein
MRRWRKANALLRAGRVGRRELTRDAMVAPFAIDRPIDGIFFFAMSGLHYANVPAVLAAGQKR